MKSSTHGRLIATLAVTTLTAVLFAASAFASTSDPPWLDCQTDNLVENVVMSTITSSSNPIENDAGFGANPAWATLTSQACTSAENVNVSTAESETDATSANIYSILSTAYRSNGVPDDFGEVTTVHDIVSPRGVSASLNVATSAPAQTAISTFNHARVQRN